VRKRAREKERERKRRRAVEEEEEEGGLWLFDNQQVTQGRQVHQREREFSNFTYTDVA
jgi:hypothetical protein